MRKDFFTTENTEPTEKPLFRKSKINHHGMRSYVMGFLRALRGLRGDDRLRSFDMLLLP